MSPARALLHPLAWLARWAHRHIWTFSALVALGLLALISLVRLFFPSLESYRPAVEAWVGSVLEQPVSIGAIHARWLGWTPELRIDDLRLLGEGGDTLLRIDSADLRIAPLDSLRSGGFVIDRLRIRGVRMNVIRQADGSLSVRGLGHAGATQNGEALGAWLFRQRRLELSSAQVVWENRKQGLSPVTLEKVEGHLRNDRGRHQLNLSLTLPAQMGQHLKLAVDVHGDLVTGAWSGRIFTEAYGLQIRPWTRHLGAGLPIRVLEARGAMQLWSAWEHAALREVHGRVSLQDLDARRGDQTLPVRQVQSAVYFSQEAGALRLGLTDLDARLSDGRRFIGDVELTRDEGGTELTAVGVRADSVDLDVLRTLLRPFIPPQEAWAQWLEEARPAGAIDALALIYRPSATLAERLRLDGRVRDLRLSASGPFPGVRGLSAAVQVRGLAGSMSLTGASLTLDLPRLFGAPIQTGELRGLLRWRHAPSGWKLEVSDLALRNSDIRLELSGRLDWPRPGQRPRVFLVGRYADADLSAIRRYMPDAVMRPGTLKWLETARLTGTGQSGALLLHGDLGDFPFDQHNGRFEVRTQVHDGGLRFLSGWPRIEGIEAEVVFHGRALEIQARRARTLNAALKDIRARIPDLHEHRPHARVTGRAVADASVGLEYLRRSPLRERFERYQEGSEMHGPIRLDLTLDIPLGHGGHTSVDGTLSLLGDRLRYQGLGLEITEISGPLYFTHASLRAQDIRARLAGQPLRVSVAHTSGEGRPPALRITATGRVRTANLRGPQHEPLSERVRGQTTWEARLTVPDASAKGRTPATRLLLRSDLKGLAIDLPAPLGKPADERRPLRARLVLGSQASHRARIDYGEQVSGELALRASDGGPALDRATFWLGATRGRLTDRPGLTVLGHIEELPVDDWLSVLEGAAGTGQEASQASALPVFLDLKARHAELLGQSAENLSLQAQRAGDGGWRLRLGSDEIAGRVTWPTALDQPIEAELERLHLRLPDSGGDLGEQDPRRLPPLRLHCQSLGYNGHLLGEARLDTERTAHGQHLRRLSVQGGVLSAMITGDWVWEAGRQRSRVHADVKSPDLGRMLEALGYEQAFLKGGKTKLTLNARWNDPPWTFALDKFSGDLYIEAREGELVEIQPGAAGRLFGLISLQALPRRLKLDFSDMFQKGFVFDRIEGHFALDEGNAYTNDLYMRSPSARIDVAGRIGLANQDYEQIVTVTPDVSSTLPIAGAVAGGPVGAVIGAAASILADKVLKDRIRPIRYRYEVTGSWQDPRVERVGKGLEEDDEDEDSRGKLGIDIP